MGEFTQLLDPMSINTSTGDVPQSKVWQHDNAWWSVLANETGTYVWRLDGTSWTSVLKLTSVNSYRADTEVVADATHILLLSSTSATPKLASIEYVPGSNGAPGTYQLWSQRPGLAGLPVIAGSLTETIDNDCTGRMWLSSDDGLDKIAVRYSDAPYTSWSDPVTLASNVSANDLSEVTALPNCTVGVLWSNQTTKRFGFRVHVDGTDPTAWSDDEVPAGGSALDVNRGMADGHLKVAVASDGTLYAAVKTSYNRTGLPQIGLLVRRPTGVWDPLYNVDDTGTRPIVLLNEARGLLRVVYTAFGRPSEILYKESPVAAISFGPRQTLICGTFNDASSSKQNFSDEMLVLASGGGSVVSALRKPGTAQNQGPLAVAGPNQKLTTLSTALDAIVCDDGLPAGAQVTSTWDVVSGPGLVTITDHSAVHTTVSFSRSGTYVLSLTASDTELSRSSNVRITIPNLAPQVNAGPDLTTTLKTPTSLDGIASDDGFPDPRQPLTTIWSVMNGPGTVAFSDASAVHIMATFSTKGTYVLRLTANDGELTTTDDVTVTVNLATSPVLVTRSFQEGMSPTPSYAGVQDTWITMGTPSQSNGSATSLTADGRTDSSIMLKWDVGSLPVGARIQSAEIAVTVTDPSAVSFPVYELKKDWSEAAATWNSYSTAGKWDIAGAQGGTDRGSAALGSVPAKSKDLVTVPLNAAGLALVQSWFDNPSANNGVILQNYDNAADTLVLSSNESSSASKRPKLNVTYRLDNYQPEVDAGPDQTTTVAIGSPLVAAVHGTVTDDGLPNPPGKLTTTWTEVSGPGSVTFANPAAIDTTATFSTKGTYVLRLTANDGVLSARDEVTIVVTVAQPFQDGVYPSPSYAGTRDALIDSLDPNSNFGSTTGLGTDGSPPSAALIKWDISSVPHGTVVQAATITLDVTKSSVSTYEIYEVKKNWTESGATWNSFSASGNWEVPGLEGSSDTGSTVLGAVSAKTTGPFTTSLNPVGLAVVQSWIDNPATNYGIVLKDFLKARDRLAFSSKEKPTATSHPKLSLTLLQNMPPVVNAGPDQTIGLNSAANLHATVTDDGRPDPTRPVSTGWSLVSGPGTVTFANPAAVDTTAIFSAVGTYVLRLTASDGRSSTTDDATVAVTLSQSFQDGLSPATSYSGTRDTAITNASSKGLGSSTTLTADGKKSSTALLEWDISSVPAGSIVQSASFTLNVTDPSLVSFPIFGLKQDWSETLATWQTFSATGKWQLPGAKGASDRGSAPLGTLSAATKGSITVPLNAAGVALIQSWVNSPGTNFGIIIQNFNAKDNIAFSSREAISPADRPKLTVNYMNGPSVKSALGLRPASGSRSSDAIDMLLSKRKLVDLLFDL